MTLAEAKRIVKSEYPDAFGWKEFATSDYVVKSSPGGKVLARAPSATHAWVEAAAGVESATVRGTAK